ncbi:MAG: hypothetical protein ACYDHC_13580 [Desulfuromonadaceae bacterium]
MNFKKVVTIAATAGALAALAVPAMAETVLYGSARLTTFWNTVDSKGTAGTNTDFEEALHGNSRIGVNFSSGKLGGKVELGVGPSSVTTRHMYGTYKFDMGTVLVGQTENPYYLPSASVAKQDGINNGYGALWDARQGQIKLTMNNGFYVAAIIPTTPNPTAAQTTAGVTAPGLSQNYLPKMNAGYEGKAGNFAYGAGVVGQTYKLQNATTGVTSASVNSLLGYFHGKLAAGPAAMQFNLGVGQNMGNMGFTLGSTTNTFVPAAGAFAKEDTLTYEGYVQGSYKLSDMLKLNAGLGYVADDNDRFAKVDDRMMMFVNTNITIAKGFSITPELAYFDQLDNTNATTFASSKGPKEYLVGAKWQMDF